MVTLARMVRPALQFCIRMCILKSIKMHTSGKYIEAIHIVCAFMCIFWSNKNCMHIVHMHAFFSFIVKLFTCHVLIYSEDSDSCVSSCKQKCKTSHASSILYTENWTAHSFTMSTQEKHPRWRTTKMHNA